MKLNLLLIFFQIWIPSSWAGTWAGSNRFPMASEDCPEADLEPIQGSHSRVAGDSESAFQAATELLDFYQAQSSRPGKPYLPSSGQALAIENPTLEPSVEFAIQAAQEKGVCIETPALEKRLSQKAPQKSGSTADCPSCRLQGNLETVAMDRILHSNIWAKNWGTAGAGKGSKEESEKQLCSSLNRNQFKNSPHGIKQSIFSTAQFIGVVQARFGTGAPLKKQPVAVMLCKPVLTQGRSFSGREFQAGSVPGSSSPVCNPRSDAFVATIYGSRRDPQTGRCELKVKQPLGTDCKTSSTTWPCKNGNLWVDIEILGKNSTQVVYLDTN